MTKYRAQRTTVDGITFDSKKEARRWGELQMLAKAGEITELERQHKIPLAMDEYPIKIRSARYPNGRRVSYVADFTYFENGQFVIEDTKGFDTPLSRLKRAIVEAMTGAEVRIT